MTRLSPRFVRFVRGSARCAALLLGVSLLSACASSGARDPQDPWGPMNRGVFWFNERVDRYGLEPVATAWDFVLPDFFQRGIRRAFDNAQAPVVVLNDFLQLKVEQGFEDAMRFVLNVSLGVGGFFDPAAEMGFPAHDEDFGQTLGVWGVPPGPYLVLPLLGPSNPRDAVGAAADGAARVYPWFLPFFVNAALTATDLTNRRSLLLEEIRESREEAFDYYVFVRNAYLQYRENQVRDSEPEEEGEDPEAGESLYYYDEEDEEE